MESYYISISSPIGSLWLCQQEDALVGIYGAVPVDLEQYEEKSTPLLEEASKQLKEYFCGTRKIFDLPLSAKGTPFQQAVWEALRQIPYGEVRSYKEIAQTIGRPNACRAVGQANNRNPLLIVQPCHRVVGSNGNLTGFAHGLDAKAFLLNLESNFK
ncbi:MAG: methylated-DNA--[Clostridia bacterium]|nr:methylated-DNA--[protein]-cysteine S-methyltransferase [Clostridia bacterium]